MNNKDFKNIKGIIFDYGGTIDTGGDHWSEIIWKAYQNGNVGVTKEDFRDAYVFAERELAKTRHILPEHNFYDLLLIKMRIELKNLAEKGLIPAESIEILSPELAEYCYKSARNWVEKARFVLEKLYSKYPLVLVSNFYGNVSAVLEDFDLLKYFKTIIESAVVGVRKPDPQIFRLGVDALALKPEETLVVGDSYKKDIVPAETIGCKVLWIKGKGWTADEDAQMHPNIIKSLEDILQLLKI